MLQLIFTTLAARKSHMYAEIVTSKLLDLNIEI